MAKLRRWVKIEQVVCKGGSEEVLYQTDFPLHRFERSEEERKKHEELELKKFLAEEIFDFCVSSPVSQDRYIRVSLFDVDSE